MKIFQDSFLSFQVFEKDDLTNDLAKVLGVSPLALAVPDIDSYYGLMHTLFTLEDCYGFSVENSDKVVVLRVDPRKGRDAAEVSRMIYAWIEQAEKYRNGEISREEYDNWRYNYPRFDGSSIHAKVPSIDLSDIFKD